MKPFLPLLCFLVGSCFCNPRAELSRESSKTMAAVVTDTINYQSQVQPIFEKKCSPCHFPGGRMYERMPFDKGETIVSHQPGILKRIKNEEEVALIKQFIQQYTSAD